MLLKCGNRKRKKIRRSDFLLYFRSISCLHSCINIMEDEMSVKRSLLLSVSLIGFSFAASAADMPAAPTAPAVVAAPATAPAATAGFVTKQELPALIKDAILKNPEVIMDAVKLLKEKQAAEAKKKTEEALAKNKDALFNDTASGSLGDPKSADITMVEFFDYHCGYCRHLLPDLAKLVKDDGKLRVIFKEFPILSEDSKSAAKAALAVNAIAKDKYFDYHTALMKHEGKYEEKDLLDMAKKLGIDTAKLKAEMAKPEINTILDKNAALAEELGIRGTPALVVGDQLAPGAMPYDDMKKLVADVRSGKKADAAPAAPVPSVPDAAAKPAAPVAAPAAPAAPVVAAPAIAVPAAPVVPPPAAPKKE
jgi:protein-disulfide isomerase